MSAYDNEAELVTRLVSRCGPELVAWAEKMRQKAHVDGEYAADNEQRMRSQAVSVVFREMAILFRGQTMQEADSAIQRDSSALQEHQQ